MACLGQGWQTIANVPVSVLAHHNWHACVRAGNQSWPRPCQSYVLVLLVAHSACLVVKGSRRWWSLLKKHGSSPLFNSTLGLYCHPNPLPIQHDTHQLWIIPVHSSGKIEWEQERPSELRLKLLLVLAFSRPYKWKYGRWREQASQQVYVKTNPMWDNICQVFHICRLILLPWAGWHVHQPLFSYIKWWNRKHQHLNWKTKHTI